MRTVLSGSSDISVVSTALLALVYARETLRANGLAVSGMSTSICTNGYTVHKLWSANTHHRWNGVVAMSESPNYTLGSLGRRILFAVFGGFIGGIIAGIVLYVMIHVIDFVIGPALR